MQLRTDDFDYTLPPELVAQDPSAERDGCRLMVLDRARRSVQHRSFVDLTEYLASGDLVVLNRSRVIPARLRGRKTSGGAVELFLLRPCGPDRWTALVRPSRRIRAGTEIAFDGGSLHAHVDEPQVDGVWIVRFRAAGDVSAALRKAGSVPLPPYITRSSAPAERYQTIFADREGSVAAPTAGLHFTEQVLTSLRDKGVRIAFVTLHIGLGTFRPVSVDRVADHVMHAEFGELPHEVASAANETRESGGRVVAVGTTTARLLESSVEGDSIVAFRGDTNRFIYPGYRFRAVDALLTNFHLPRSTLLMLVSAFAGRDFILDAYREGIAERYRFYSFGDAMLIT